MGTDSSPSGIVRTISVPGLVLHGTGDEFVPLEHASRLHSNWTRSTLELLPGARHFAILRSAEVQKLVSGHLQEAR